MKPLRIDPIARCLMLTLCVATLAGSRDALAAETEATTSQVEINVFSGRHNPVFKLEESEIVHVKELVAKAKLAPEGKAKAKAFPSRPGYRGTSIHFVEQAKAMQSAIRVRGGIILEQSGQAETWRSSDDTALEYYLVALALEKGAIDQYSLYRIRDAIDKAAAERN